MNERTLSPCSKCPYMLGQIKTLINPCPQCKLSGYKYYKQLIKDLSKSERRKLL